MRAASLVTDASEDMSDAVASSSGLGSGVAGEWQEKVRNLNLEKEGLLHFIQHLKTRSTQLQTENDTLRASSSPSSTSEERKPQTPDSLRAAHANLQSTHRESQRTIAELRETVAALQMDKDVLGHEVGGLRLERTGWEMERQRINLELQECEAERTTLCGKVSELQRTEGPRLHAALRTDETPPNDVDGEGKHFPKYIRELQIEKDGLQGRLDATLTALRHAEDELRRERGQHGERVSAAQALREQVAQLQTDLQNSRAVQAQGKDHLLALEHQLAQRKETTREIEEKLLLVSTELVDERRKHLVTTHRSRTVQSELDKVRAEVEKAGNKLRVMRDEKEATLRELEKRNRAYEGLQADLRRLCGGTLDDGDQQAESAVALGTEVVPSDESLERRKKRKPEQREEGDALVDGEVVRKRKKVKIESSGVSIAQPTVPASSRLPPEIHATIAGFLAGVNAFRSLAAYNIVNQGIHQSTLPVLFKVVVIDGPLPPRGDEEYGMTVVKRRRAKYNRGWKHVQYLIVSDDHAERIKQLIERTDSRKSNAKPNPTYRESLLRAFPQLRMRLVWGMKPSAIQAKQIRRTGILDLYKDTDFRILHQLLRGVHLHTWKREALTRRGLDTLSTIRCAPGVQLLNDRLVHRQRDIFFNVHGDDLEVILEDTGGKTIPTAIPSLVEQLLRFQRPNKNVYPSKPNGPQFSLSFPKVRLGGITSIFERLAGHPIWWRSDWQMNATIGDIQGELATPEEIRSDFDLAINCIASVWNRFPDEQLNKEDQGGSRMPIFVFHGIAKNDVRVEMVVKSSPNPVVKAFNAHVRAVDASGNTLTLPGITSSASYSPAASS